MAFLRFLYRMLREQKSKFITVAVLMAIVAVLEGVIIMLVVPLLNLIVEGNVAQEGFLDKAAMLLEKALHFFNTELSLGIVLGIIVIMFVIQGLFRLLQMHVQMKIVTNYESSLIHKLFSDFLSSSWVFFLRNKIGQLINVLSMETNRAANAFQFSFQFVASLLIAAFYAALASFISWEITLTGLVLCSIASLLLRKLMKQARKYGFGTSEANNELQAYAFDKLGAAKMLKASASGQKAMDGMSPIIKRKVHLRYLSIMNATAIRSVYEPIAMGILALIGYFAVSRWGADIATIILFVFIFFRLVPHFNALQRSYQQALVFMPGLDEVDKLMEQMKGMPDTGGDKRFEGFNDAIVFDNVSFAYDAGSPTLKNVNIKLKKGETVAIVGESGAGKTTLVDLLLALFSPTKGRVLVDSIPLSDYDVASWRKSIGYMSQEVFLFHDTIESNLKWNTPDASEEKVKTATKVAYADEFLDEIPDKYNTIVGDRGVRLSVGQRQRLALARTILQNPEIIILDEATSSLDSESETLIQQAIDEIWSQKTMVIIAHRLATVKNADRIYVLEGGSIVESGTWDELVAMGGRFEQLRNMQNL